MTKRKRGKTRWRDYLNNKYIVTDERLLNELRHGIRRRAIKMMEDLLLILEKSDARQLDLIRYHWVKERDARKFEKKKMLILALLRQIQNKLIYLFKTKDKEIRQLFEDLNAFGIPYDIVKLVEDKAYRDNKRVKVFSVKYR
jgi:hypothetical protein